MSLEEFMGLEFEQIEKYIDRMLDTKQREKAAINSNTKKT